MGDGITLRWFSWGEETDIGLCFYGECVIEGGNYDGGQEGSYFWQVQLTILSEGKVCLRG